MDFLHDNSHRVWVQIANEYNDIPNYVMDYSMPDKEAAAQMDDDLFADMSRRLFPINSKGATWLSAAYFVKNSDLLPYNDEEREYVESEIKRAASIFGIKDDVENVMTHLRNSGVKQAEAKEDNISNYGLVRYDKSGNIIDKKYPMFDANGVKKASVYFSENRTKYPTKLRKKIAKAILKKAAEHNVSIEQLTPEVLRECGYGIASKDMLMNELFERAHLSKCAELATAIANINELIFASTPEELAGCLSKIAEVIETFDSANGFEVIYNKQILMPADIVYNTTIKEAKATVEDAVELNKYIFSLAKLAELPASVYSEVFGPDFVKAISNPDKTINISKLADELYSLPKPDKQMLESYLIQKYKD